MAVVLVRGGQLNISDVATQIAQDTGATAALAQTFFPYTGGTILGETVLCYDAPCIWFKDPPFPGCDTGHLWRTVVKNGVFIVGLNSGSFQSVPPFSQPNGFIAQGPPFLYNNFVPGYVFSVCGSLGNDGIYRVAAPVQPFGPDTLIPVVQTIPNPGAPGGVIQDFSFETEMLQLSLTGGVVVPSSTRLTADGGLTVNSFFDVFVDIDMNNNNMLNVNTITHVNSNGGTFTSQLPVQPKFVFKESGTAGFPQNGVWRMEVNSDTLVVRKNTALAGDFSTSTVPIEMVALSLTSHVPIIMSPSNKITGLANGTGSGDALHFGQIGTQIAAFSHTHVLADITNVTATATQVNFLVGVTSLVQTQLNNKQPLDATLTSIASLGTVADRVAFTTGVDTWAETPLTSFARTLIDDTTALAARSTLGVVIGTDVQAWDADLDALAALSLTGLIARTSAGMAAARTLTSTTLALSISDGGGTVGNPTFSLDTDLTDIAALSAGEGQFIVRSTSAWVASGRCRVFDGTVQTTNATATVVKSIALASTDVLTFTVRGHGFEPATGDTYSRVLHGTIENVTGTTSIVGTNTNAHTANDAGAATWSITAVANNTTDVLEVTVMGEAAKTINWHVCVEVTEGS